ncbi:MAG: universal stress protein, partial [Mucilaginibacter sp.]
IYFGESGLGNLIILSQVVLSLQLGFAVIPLIHFTSDRKRMGKFAISLKVKILAWASAALIIGLNAKLVVDQINDWIKQYPSAAIWIYDLVVPITISVAVLLVHVFLKPVLFKHKDRPAQVPHGLAAKISDLTPIVYKNIGITIDFSKNDKDCIRHAIMQGAMQANYTLIHVVETAGARYYGTEVLDHETQSDADNLDKYVRSLKEMGYSAQGKIGFGRAAKSIAQIVNDEHIDFIVMGSHGHKVIKDLIFGTTVNSVRHLVNVPVLVVKPQ